MLKILVIIYGIFNVLFVGLFEFLRKNLIVIDVLPVFDEFG